MTLGEKRRAFFKTASWAAAFCFIYWLIAWVVFSSEDAVKILLKEDRLMEMATALFFLLGFIHAVKRLRGSRDARLYPSLWLIPALSLIEFLEEISYGRTFYGYFERPVVMGKKIDSLHDFLPVFIRLAKRDLGFPLSFALVLIPFLAAALLLFRYRESLKKLLKTRPATHYVILSIAFTFIALFADLPFIEGPEFGFRHLLEELLEFYAGLAMFFAAISLSRPEKPAPRSGSS